MEMPTPDATARVARAPLKEPSAKTPEPPQEKPKAPPRSGYNTNRPHAFKHRDVVRIIKAARAAGVDVNQVTVDPHTGAITVGPAQGANHTGMLNAWDEVLSANAEDAKRSA